jgi:alpha-amylase/alpha-mannosidase (GH57 family)
MNKYICIHGHFYQPPRENAWLEEIEVQDSAHPYHDWNQRINAECYAPNTASRILSENSVISNIVNNYSRISFNFGPTLLSWMERFDKITYQAIIDADKESLNLFNGHGSAMAQVYNHMIMPLANRADKKTQVIWGIKDFEYRFGRYPEGMWLAETAVDTETLEILADHKIKFTLLAPRQAKAFRNIGDEQWNNLEQSQINTDLPYVINLPSGKQIIAFFYNGVISQEVAFNGLLNDGKNFAKRMINAINKSDPEPQLVNIATDGESYGHHHKHGDMALAFCIDEIIRDKSVSITNYAAYLEKFPPTHEAQIIENSSWSCIHGIERWRNNCGCNSGGKPGWNQLWRKPLREALDWLRDELTIVYNEESAKIFIDPNKARDEFIEIILNRDEEIVHAFVSKNLKSEASVTHALRLLEIQRNAMLMYTSCGWFFDEISGIETTQILQYACRAIQLASQVSDKELDEIFTNKLSVAPSNESIYADGRRVYRKLVKPALINLKRVGMHYAVASIFEEDPEDLPLFNYKTTKEFFVRKEAGEQKLAFGITKIKSKVTWSEKRFVFAVLYLGQHTIIGNISLDMDEEKFKNMQVRILKAFDESRVGDIIGIMQTFFGPDKYTLWNLFKDEKRKVLNMIMEKSMTQVESSFRKIYNRDYPLINALSKNEIPIPIAYKTTLQYVVNADLKKCFNSERVNIQELQRIEAELSKWKLKIEDPDKIAQLAEVHIYSILNYIQKEKENVGRIERLNNLFPFLLRFKIKPNLYQSQNLYFRIARQNGVEIAPYKSDPEWIRQFETLGLNLGVKVEVV